MSCVLLFITIIIIIIGQFLRNTEEALGDLLFNMANALTSCPLVFQMINSQTLNKTSFGFFKLPFECLKLLIKVSEYNFSIKFYFVFIDADCSTFCNNDSIKDSLF